MQRAWTAAAIAVLLLTIASAARAGGSWLEPTRVRVEAGDTITLSGNVSSSQLGWVQDGPYFAFLSGSTFGSTITEGSGGLETDVPLGQLDIYASGDSAQVSIEFTLPGDVPPGEYRVTTCNTPCRTGFGDLLGATLFVGIDPPANGGATDGTGSISAASLVLAGSEAANASHSNETAAMSLTLARQPARATGLNATWIALSAGFGLTVLLLVSLVRTKGG